MPNEINNLDPLDIGLKQIMGDHFHDDTATRPATPSKERTTKDTTAPKKAEQKPSKKMAKEDNDAADAHWQPVKPTPNFIDKLKAGAMCASIFGGLNFLIFYWMNAGLMAQSIAIPCMWVCVLLAGFGVGRNFR